jgi:hypothetical protein
LLWLRIAYFEKKAPIYPKVTYPEYKEANLLVINPADIHIGKLSSHFETKDAHNNDIIIERVKEGIRGIISKSKGFPIDKILFIIGADILHTDNTKRQTTSLTPQDTDGMWYDNFLLAQKLYVEIIEELVQIAPLKVQYDPSNHDYMSGFFLAQCIQGWFRNTDIEFNVDISHRKYHAYHSNLIGTTHGDGAKETDLALLMAQEASEHWHKCKNRYFFIEHIHHKKSKDYVGFHNVKYKNIDSNIDMNSISFQTRPIIRTWQINQPFQNMNGDVNIPDELSDILENSPIIKQLGYTDPRKIK